MYIRKVLTPFCKFGHTFRFRWNLIIHTLDMSAKTKMTQVIEKCSYTKFEGDMANVMIYQDFII